MALDLTPATWLGGGYATDSGNHLIKFNTTTAASNKLLAQLSDAQADPTTGDIRRIIFAMMEALFTQWAAQPTSNQPSKLTMNRGINPDAAGNLQYTYTVTVLLTPPTGQFTIPAEPS